MQLEVDQSGKFEQLNTHTVVACANEESAVIRIYASAKRKLIQQLRRSLVPRKDLIPIIFSALVFLALKQLKQFPAIIVIDEEYPAKEDIVRESLKKLINKHTQNKWQGYIRFKRIGKSSPAHKLAWQTHRAKRTIKAHNVNESDILKIWE